VVGAVSAVSLREKKLPTWLIIVNGPEPDTVTCTTPPPGLPESATGFGVALNCDCERPGTATSSAMAKRRAAFLNDF
jgi:hypothetical protein